MLSQFDPISNLNPLRKRENETDQDTTSSLHTVRLRSGLNNKIVW